MSEILAALANNIETKKAGKYLHVEVTKHTTLIVMSFVWLFISAALVWQVTSQCGNACTVGEHLFMFSPAVGVMLLAYGCSLIYLRKRLGDLVLQLQQPLHPGCDKVPATLYFIKGLGHRMRRPAAAYPVNVEIVCTHEDNAGEGSSTQTLWSQELKFKSVAHCTGITDFTISLPANLPVSGNLGRSQIKIFWKLRVRVLGAKVSFILPVRVGQVAAP